MKCKLLVAEDELIERKVLCKTLQKYLGDLIVLYEARNGGRHWSCLPGRPRRWSSWTLRCQATPGWKWPARSGRRTRTAASSS